MATYTVSANSITFGSYTADSAQEARDLCAQDAGYADECDMAARLGIPSELVCHEAPEYDPLHDFNYVGSVYHY